MKRSVIISCLVLAVGASDLSLRARAADTRSAASTPPIVLPPMLVEESKSSVPWWYVNVGGTEFLSRCSRFTTEEFVDAWLNRMQLMRVLVPDYGLAPEHPFPGALAEALAVYQAVVEADDGPIFVGGDSAGGGLACSLVLALLANGAPAPQGAAGSS